MHRSAFALLAVAGASAGIDLAHKAIAESERGATIAYHSRSVGWIVGVAVGAAVWAVAICATRSLSLAIPGGLVLGGTLANVASVALWPSRGGVPNPLTGAGGLAYNLADALMLLGFAFLLPAAGLLAIRQRARLLEPVSLRQRA